MEIKEVTSKERQTLIDKFGRLDIHEYEAPRNKFCVGILDLFNKALSFKEADERIISYNTECEENSKIRREYLIREAKFVEFIKFATIINNEDFIYIYCPDILELKGKRHSFLTKFLSNSDNELLRPQVRKIKDKEGLFKVDAELLSIFVKLSTRELYFSNFFFRNSNSVVIGNYDLSFPVYSIDTFVMDKYEKKAHEIGLYIRK